MHAVALSSCAGWGELGRRARPDARTPPCARCTLASPCVEQLPVLTKMLHDGCVGASITSAAPALVTPDTAPTRTTTTITTSGGARKALAAPLPSDALSTGGVSVTHQPSGAPRPPPSLPLSRGARSGVGGLSGRGGRRDGDFRGDGGSLSELQPAHSRGRGPSGDDAALSCRLSRLLRHGLLAAGLRPAPDGYVPLAAVLRCRGFGGVTVDSVCACVASSEKQRFSLVRRLPSEWNGGPAGGAHGVNTSAAAPSGAVATSVDGHTSGPAGDGELHIRANQGFSTAVALYLSPDAVYTRLVPPAAGSPPLLGVHATTLMAFARICADDGLRAMRRDAVHFARLAPSSPPPSPSATPKAASPLKDHTEVDVLHEVVAGVRSGRRRGGVQVYRIALVVDVGASAAAGVVWYVSSNDVLLTQGGAAGVLDKRWVVRVTDVVSGADRTADLWVAPTGGADGRA